MAELMMIIFTQYMQVDDIVNRPTDKNDPDQFHTLMNTIEKDFNRTNEFISISLMILGKKGGFPWCKFIQS